MDIKKLDNVITELESTTKKMKSLVKIHQEIDTMKSALAIQGEKLTEQVTSSQQLNETTAQTCVEIDTKVGAIDNSILKFQAKLERNLDTNLNALKIALQNDIRAEAQRNKEALDASLVSYNVAIQKTLSLVKVIGIVGILLLVAILGLVVYSQFFAV